jgi:hypothetical protein
MINHVEILWGVMGLWKEKMLGQEKDYRDLTIGSRTIGEMPRRW